MLQQDTVQQLKNVLVEEDEESTLCVILNAILELNESILNDKIETHEKHLFQAEELLESYKY
jgi:hypothetical protein